jgi:aryl-alcohol dehydrogenase-like predicted oxidoreductase
MEIDSGDMPWDELALRFAAYCPGVSTAIVGTSSIENLERNVVLANRGPLPNDTVAQIRQAFQRHDQEWVGQI